jgi:hypothetical protein
VLRNCNRTKTKSQACPAVNMPPLALYLDAITMASFFGFSSSSCSAFCENFSRPYIFERCQIDSQNITLSTRLCMKTTFKMVFSHKPLLAAWTGCAFLVLKAVSLDSDSDSDLGYFTAFGLRTSPSSSLHRARLVRRSTSWERCGLCILYLRGKKPAITTSEDAAFVVLI